MGNAIEPFKLVNSDAQACARQTVKRKSRFVGANVGAKKAKSI
jgi:hypothetical protein